MIKHLVPEEIKYTVEFFMTAVFGPSRQAGLSGVDYFV
jgi:hypothetical protein